MCRSRRLELQNAEYAGCRGGWSRECERVSKAEDQQAAVLNARMLLALNAVSERGAREVTPRNSPAGQVTVTLSALTASLHCAPEPEHSFQVSSIQRRSVIPELLFAEPLPLVHCGPAPSSTDKYSSSSGPDQWVIASRLGCGGLSYPLIPFHALSVPCPKLKCIQFVYTQHITSPRIIMEEEGRLSSRSGRSVRTVLKLVLGPGSLSA